MNDLYFRCEDCKRFVDAGYRWAFRTLVQTGVVAEDDFGDGGSNLPSVSAAAVLAADEYWGDSDGDGRSRAALASQLTRVREFLTAHQSHRLSFGDIHRLHQPPNEWLDWLSEDHHALLPRTFVEVLRFSTWAEVERYVGRAARAPWWWSRTNRVAARRKFEELVQGVRHS